MAAECLVVYVLGCNGVCSGELYFIYKKLWDASVGEELPCKKDIGNDTD